MQSRRLSLLTSKIDTLEKKKARYYLFLACGPVTILTELKIKNDILTHLRTYYR